MSSTYNTNEFRAGLKVLIDGSPYVILENEFVKPGKGQAFNRVRMRNLMNNRILERTFKSGESVPAADIVDAEMQLVYHGQGTWQFMNQETFEQLEVTDQQMGDAIYWAKDQDICTLTLYNGIPITVVPPIFAIQQIIETDPGLRGDTSGGGGKPAKLEGGATVRVPLFVQQGEYIKVDTRTTEYVSRANKDDINK